MEKNYNDEGYTNDLVDLYKQTNSIELRDELLDNFSPYFKKYVNIMCGRHAVDVENSDTLKFLRLFMSAEDRTDNSRCVRACYKWINIFRKAFVDYTSKDLYYELVVFFLEALEKYKPMIADHKRSRERISFTHYIQVNMRFRLKALVVAKSRDALSTEENLPYNEAIFKTARLSPVGTVIDIQWVHGYAVGDKFKLLSPSERYLLWLKYESSANGNMLSARDISGITGLHYKTVEGRINKIRGKLKETI